jgi:hypothetical protein
MKKLLLILSVLLISCESKYSYKDSHENAIISYIEIRKPDGKSGEYCNVYIHTEKETIRINVGYENKDKFKVGDAIPLMLVLIENK